MMDRYTLLQKIGIYAAMAVFLTFILLPFFEMFMTSLRPLNHLFRSPLPVLVRGFFIPSL